ncbi:hypothetical protein HMPREF9141_2771 [Prevotella multiformis DSM 16608]|uniref:Uncharacterized protein n=1 Tax=Prevotella multiformis DSM 16608 TaxID=888743 RepID=F0FB04_9BACT|nr:hypothetical protein HMPREF9141_2771 [Prevotella multiformis DSM 16608]
MGINTLEKDGSTLEKDGKTQKAECGLGRTPLHELLGNVAHC